MKINTMKYIIILVITSLVTACGGSTSSLTKEQYLEKYIRAQAAGTSESFVDDLPDVDGALRTMYYAMEKEAQRVSPKPEQIVDIDIVQDDKGDFRRLGAGTHFYVTILLTNGKTTKRTSYWVLGTPGKWHLGY